MKRIKYVLLSLPMIFSIISSAAKTVSADENWPEPPAINAESAIIMEADSGAILYEKNINEQHYPASITKIMTSLLAIENCPLSDTIHFSKDSIYNVEGTQVGITENEELPLDECLYGIMLASGNEVAYAVAEHVGGDITTFVNMMNERAAQLGCINTHFNNPHGLPDENHYTTAYDMALIACKAYSIESFRTFAGTRYHVIPPTNLYGEERAIANHHKMLTNSIYHYDFCTGGKTGYTNAARYNLVTFSEKDGMKLICVIMKDEESAFQYNDTKNLFDYCFQNFKKTAVTTNDLGVNLSESGLFPIKNTTFTDTTSEISICDNSYVIIPNNLELGNLTRNVDYNETKDESIASINYTYDNHLLGSIPITCTQKAPIATQKASIVTNTSDKFFKINLRIIIYIIAGICVGILLIGFIIRFAFNYRFANSSVLKYHKTNHRMFKADKRISLNLRSKKNKK